MARLAREFDVEIHWRGFELHPSTPRGGMPITALFPAHLGDGLGPTMHARLAQFAAGFGVTGLQPSQHIPNTRRALAVAELARDAGRLLPFREAAMDAHWRDGRDLEDLDVLASLAQATGLDPDAARAAADSPAYQRRVDDLREEAGAMGVSGIPTFIFGVAPPTPGARPSRGVGVVGCQPWEALQAAAMRAGARRRGM